MPHKDLQNRTEPDMCHNKEKTLTMEEKEPPHYWDCQVLLSTCSVALLFWVALKKFVAGKHLDPRDHKKV